MTFGAFLRVANLVLFIVNIGLFALWFSLIRKDALPPGGDAATYVLNQIGIQVTVLGVMIALGAVLLAGLGFFGFQVVLERAENRAEQIARQLVAQKWDDMVRETPNIVFRPAAKGPLPEVKNPQEVQDD